jgi:hypothetical protein
MKITKDRLTQMIRETVIKIAERDEGEDEGEGAEVATDEAEDILERLKDILEKWAEADYASETDRWQDYAEDIQSLVDEYKEEEPEKKKEKDWGGGKGEKSATHPGEKDYTSTKKGDKTAKGTSAYSQQKAPSSPKSKGPKLAKMTYEAKKLEEAVYKKLKTMLKKQRVK